MRARIPNMTGLSRVLLAVASLLVGIPARAADVTFDLCAKTGSVTMPDSVAVNIWGFALKPSDMECSDASVVAGLPGPRLTVNAGDAVAVNLYNTLAENVSLRFPGQSLFPDTVGAVPGGTKAYTFTAGNPGTYLYESGTNSPIQVPMGLYGALIVRPAASGQAYNNPGSAFDSEAVLLLSEIDPAQHAAPTTFNPLDYAPKYWLINGKAYPATDLIQVPAGNRLLLRYLNAGSLNHTMTLLGTHQRVIAKDANPAAFPYDLVAETIPSGSTLDTIATIPSGATVGSRLPLYNRQLHLTNVATFPGGMLTFVEVQAGGGPTNQPPSVNAGSDQTITLPASATLDGAVTDDGLPSGTLTTIWTQQSGPGTVTFGDASAVDTTASFSAAGSYVLRLTANDGALSAFDEATISVNPVPSMHVGDLGGTSVNLPAPPPNRWRATVTATVHNASHNPVAAAIVTGTWSAGDSNGRTLSCTTNGSGQCSVTSGRIPRSTTGVTFAVTGVTNGLTYQASANHDPDGDSNGTSITVNKP